MTTSRLSLTLLGCGKMGGALLTAWLHKNLLRQAVVIEPNILQDIALHQDKSVQHIKNYTGQPIETDVLILATKPQVLAEAVRPMKDRVHPRTLILSIAAGQSLESLGFLFSGSNAIIRAMPNTPAAIGKGISAAIGNVHVTVAQKTIAQCLLEAAGPIVWLEDEAQMDAVTALSGSGPAYVFYLIEALAAAGGKLGLPIDQAMMLARQTMIGSAALAEASPEISTETLRRNVTSPGGTTEAALKILMDGRFQSLLDEALKGAAERGQALNKP